MTFRYGIIVGKLQNILPPDAACGQGRTIFSERSEYTRVKQIIMNVQNVRHNRPISVMLKQSSFFRISF
jgi:hypothetical protein